MPPPVATVEGRPFPAPTARLLCAPTRARGPQPTPDVARPRDRRRGCRPDGAAAAPTGSATMKSDDRRYPRGTTAPISLPPMPRPRTRRRSLRSRPKTTLAARAEGPGLEVDVGWRRSCRRSTRTCPTRAGAEEEGAALRAAAAISSRPQPARRPRLRHQGPTALGRTTRVRPCCPADADLRRCKSLQTALCRPGNGVRVHRPTCFRHRCRSSGVRPRIRIRSRHLPPPRTTRLNRIRTRIHSLTPIRCNTPPPEDARPSRHLSLVRTRPPPRHTRRRPPSRPMRLLRRRSTTRSSPAPRSQGLQAVTESECRLRTAATRASAGAGLAAIRARAPTRATRLSGNGTASTGASATAYGGTATGQAGRRCVPSARCR